MASQRINATLQEELDISTKISNLEERASNLETEFSLLLQHARNLALTTKRYVERRDIENKSRDLLEAIMDPECKLNPQKRTGQIMDYMRVFFKFLLGRLQRHGAEIVDLAMLWPLLDTEGIKHLFKDSIVWFGFKESDIPNLKILLAATHKYNKIKMGDKAESKDPPTQSSDDTDANKQIDCQQSKDQDDSKQNDEIEEKLKNLLKVAKYMYCNQSAVPLHDAPIDDLLKTDDVVYRDLDILNIDDEIRKVIERMIAIVIYTLNIGTKTCLQGLYGPETGETDIGIRELDKDNQNNNATVVTTCTEESLTYSPVLPNKKIEFEGNTSSKTFEEDTSEIIVEEKAAHPENETQMHKTDGCDDSSRNVVTAKSVSVTANTVKVDTGSDNHDQHVVATVSPVTPDLIDKNDNVKIDEAVQTQDNTEDSLYQVTQSFYIQKSKGEGATYDDGQKQKSQGAKVNPNGTVSDTISEEEEIALLERNVSFDETIQSLEDAIDYNMEIKLLLEKCI